MVKVKIFNRLYEMPMSRLNGLLQIAKEQVNHGIYCVKYHDYYELRKDELTKTQLKKAKREYKSKGMTVYANE